MSGAAPAVGWVGLGAIGLPMAARAVARGLRVMAFDPVPERRAAAVDAGLEVAAEPAALAAEAGDLVFCVVRTQAQVEASLLGPDGALARGGTGVVMSSVGAEAIRELGAQAQARSTRLVDAPILGNAAGAEAGSLIVPVAGDQAGLNQVRPVLDTFSASVIHVGERLGAAQAVKDVVQQVQIIGMLATIEGLALAAGEGVEEDLMLEIMGQNEPIWATANWRYAKDLWERGDPETSLGLFAKDLASALVDGGNAGVEMPLTKRASELITARLKVSESQQESE